MHAPMMVTHSVQVIQDVRCISASFRPVFPARRRSGTAASLDHVAAHIEACEGEVDESGELVSALSHLPEAFEVED